MKNIIIVGDSFCVNSKGWPEHLAKLLNLKLINYGLGGGAWWSVNRFLLTLTQEQIDNSEIIIFVHTNAERIPTTVEEINCINLLDLNLNNELERAVSLHYKYIHDSDFLCWAQSKWFEEINDRWSNIKVIHLHSFPDSLIQRGHLLRGMQIIPSLSTISLDEIAAKDNILIGDMRINHLNTYNNTELAQQLFQLIGNYQVGKVSLDISKFNLLSNHWTQKWN